MPSLFTAETGNGLDVVDTVEAVAADDPLI